MAATDHVTQPAVIRVLLAEDQPLVRAGVRALVESEDGMSVCGEAATGADAVRLVREIRPDVVVMDIRMPELNGIEATQRLAESGDLDEVKVLILTTFESDQYVFEALRAGACGFLLKDAEPEVILRAIRTVAAGEALLSPRVTRRLISEFASRPSARITPERVAPLTPREREVLALAAHGLSNAEIADRLVITDATAKTHIARAMRKLEAASRAQLVVIAYQSGLVEPGELLDDPPESSSGSPEATADTTT